MPKYPKHPKKANDDRSNDSGVNPGARPGESFEEFYRQHRTHFEKRLARGVPPEDAEDLAQDVWMSIWRGLRIGKIRNLPGVIARAFKNARVDRWRKQSTRQNYEEQFARECELLRAAPPGAESAALLAERERLLRVLHNEEPDAYRAFVMRRYGGLSWSEIADAMGISRNKAAQLVARALIKLQEAGAGEDTL
jgi:RNA polymerase sigma factor (sigma-70 family)